MRRIFQIVVLIVITVNNSNSKDLSFGFQTGIGTYSMSGLKNLNYALPELLAFDTKLVSNFPEYWYYRPSFGMKFKGFGIGLVYLYQSTGSRVSAADYSGEYRFDMKVKSYSPGICVDVNLLHLYNFQFAAYSVLGLLSSKLKITEYLNAMEMELVNDTYDFKAHNNYFEPGFNFVYRYKFIGVGISGGYLIQFGKQEFYRGKYQKVRLYEFDGREAIKPEWNGFRFGISVYCNLSIKAK